MAKYVTLEKGAAPTAPRDTAAVKVYADTDAALHTLESDGTNTTVGSGGGGSVVACVLAPSATIDPNDANPVYFVWDTIYDNVTDANQLEALPDGIGIDPLSIGSDTLTFTEAGIWAFTVDALLIPVDDTWSGQVIFGNNQLTQIIPAPVQAVDVPHAILTSRTFLPAGVFNFPASAGFSIGIATDNAPTADPFACSMAAMCVVRIG